jgi:general secretion pathway protein C
MNERSAACTLGTFLALRAGMAMQTILRRSFPGVVLLLIAVVAYLQVRGTAALIEALLISPSRGPSSPQLEAGPQAPGAAPNPAGLVSQLAISGAPKLPGANANDPLAWPVCQGVRALIVTEFRDPLWSLATLQGQAEERARLRRVGDDFAGRKVAFTGFNPRQGTPAVWLEGKDDLCQSPLFGSGSLATTAPAKPLEPAARQPDPATLQGGLFRQLRVVPEQQEGKVVGLRLFGVRPGSLLATLGLKNGDRLETINGFSIANPEEALQVYARLRTAEHLRLRVTRAGQPLDIELHIS